MTLRDAMYDTSVCFYDFYSQLQDLTEGTYNWDNVNSTESVKRYIHDHLDSVRLGDYVKAFQSESSEHDLWMVDFGYGALDHPVAINTKEDLAEAIGITEGELATLYWEV